MSFGRRLPPVIFCLFLLFLGGLSGCSRGNDRTLTPYATPTSSQTALCIPEVVTLYFDGDGDGYGCQEGDVGCSDQSPLRVSLGCGESQPPGFAEYTGDCDDEQADTYPHAVERCDGRDQDCDNRVDEGEIALLFEDRDRDGFGSGVGEATACKEVDGKAERGGDCDDQISWTYPGAQEVCDGADNDCDGEKDEDLVSEESWYNDADGDGYAQTEAQAIVTVVCVDDPVITDADLVPQTGDCNDSDPFTYPGAVEECDGQDNNCDGVEDIDAIGLESQIYWNDADGDGFGDALSLSSPEPGSPCVPPPEGIALRGGDCDDDNAEVNPLAMEVCDAIDNDCNGRIDDVGIGEGIIFYPDNDADNYGVDPSKVCGGAGQPSRVACSAPPGYSMLSGDCDDEDAQTYPGSTDLPGDGIDQNCDGYPEPYPDLNGIESPLERAFPDLLIANAGPLGEDDQTTTIIWGSEELAAGGELDQGRLDFESDGAIGFCIGDLDLNGYNDLVILEEETAQFRVLLFGGDQYILRDIPYPTNIPSDCALADLNGDGLLDLVVAINRGDGEIEPGRADSQIYYNLYNGDSSETIGEPFASSPDISLQTTGADRVTVADIDGRGDHLDIIFTSEIVSIPARLYLFRDGLSQSCDLDSEVIVQDQELLPSMPGVPALVDDLNADGMPDVVIASPLADGLRDGQTFVLMGSEGYFDTDSCGPLGADGIGCLQLSTGRVQNLFSSDLDKDGYRDLVIANTVSPQHVGELVALDVFRGDNLGFFKTETLNTHGASDLEVADLNQDGFEDMIVSVLTDGHETTTSMVFYGGPSGFSERHKSELMTRLAMDVELADMDGNGYLDVIFGNGAVGDDDGALARIYWNSSRGLEQTRRTELLGQDTRHITFGDFNADGKTDLVTSVFSDGGARNTTSYVYWGSDQGIKVENHTALPTTGARWACSGDIDGDGIDDLVFANHQHDMVGYETQSYIYWGSESGFSCANGGQGTLGPCATVSTMGAVQCLLSDIDADGDLDLVFANQRDSIGVATESYVYWNRRNLQEYSERTSIFTPDDRSDLETVNTVGVEAKNLDGNTGLELIFSNGLSNDGQLQQSQVYYFSTDSTVLQGLPNPTGATGGAISVGNPLSLDSGLPTRRPIISDVNDDGDWDIILPAFEPDHEEWPSTRVYCGPFGQSSQVPAYYEFEGLNVQDARMVDDPNNSEEDKLLLLLSDGLGTPREDGCEGSCFYRLDENCSHATRRSRLTVGTGQQVLEANLVLEEESPDLAILSDENVRVFSGETNQISLSSTVPFENGIYINTADLDGEGADDLVIARSGSGDESGSIILWNNGTRISERNHTDLLCPYADGEGCAGVKVIQAIGRCAYPELDDCK